MDLHPSNPNSVMLSLPTLQRLTEGNIPAIEGLARFFDKTNRSATRPSPLQAIFVSFQNAEFLRSRVEELLTKLSGGMKTLVYIDESWVSYMLQMAQSNPGLDASPENLVRLNQAFITSQLELQFYSLSHQRLYRKYFIDKDRVRNLPFPQYTSGDSVTVESSGYLLSNPWARNRASFLQATTGLIPAPGLTPTGFVRGPSAWIADPGEVDQANAEVTTTATWDRMTETNRDFYLNQPSFVSPAVQLTDSLLQ